MDGKAAGEQVVKLRDAVRKLKQVLTLKINMLFDMLEADVHNREIVKPPHHQARTEFQI